MAERPTPGTVEQRAAPEVAAPAVEGKRLRGRIPYSTPSADLGGWREIIEPGALANADLSRLVLTVDHQGIPLARHPATLHVEDRADALHWDAELGASRADVREAVERGDLHSASWRMVVAPGGDEWRDDVRHVHRIAELRDVAVVTSPAYSEARAELRSAPEPQPEPEEAPVPESTSGLTVESRSTEEVHNEPTPAGTVEERILDAIRQVPRGESRSLTEAATATPITPLEISTQLWDRLRDAAVVLASGVPIISTTARAITWPRLISDITADFYDELDEIAESDPGFDEYEVTPRAIKALVRASAEAVEDSDPDLLQVVQSNLETILALKLDREMLVGNSAKGFAGMTNTPGVTTIDAEGAMPTYDLILRAVGVLGGQHIPGPYAIAAHPWSATYLSRLKSFTSTQSNEALPRPVGLPPMFLTTQVGLTGVGADGVAPMVVYAPRSLACVRRRDVTIEIDRSEEFSSDAVLIRGKLRATLFVPHLEAICVIANAPAPDPSAA